LAPISNSLILCASAPLRDHPKKRKPPTQLFLKIQFQLALSLRKSENLPIAYKVVSKRQDLHLKWKDEAMSRQIPIMISLLLAACIGILVYQNTTLRDRNHRLRDHIHATNLMITNTNMMSDGLLRHAYIGHTLEKAEMFGKGNPPFFGVVFSASSNELATAKGNTMVLLDERFATHRQKLEQTLAVKYDDHLFRIKDGKLVDPSNKEPQATR